MDSDRLRVLFATPECAPWVKTGGLGDVGAALPAALEAGGLDVRVLLPAYRPVLAATAGHRRELASIAAGARLPAARVLEAPLPSGVPAWLVDCPALYDRDGGLYQDPGSGGDWPDNAVRFALLARVAALLAGESSPLAWRPQVLHCNDWQTALAPAYLRFAAGTRAATVMCIHNLAFQGLFPPASAAAVELPPAAYSVDGAEFYGRLSFLKAGLVYADAITTVSPTYAQEIQREPLGFGLQGLLAARAGDLHGILNGIDDAVWNPAIDPLIAQPLRRRARGSEARQQARIAGAARVARGPRRAALRLRRPAHPAEGRRPDRGERRAHRRGAGADRRPRLGRARARGGAAGARPRAPARGRGQDRLRRAARAPDRGRRGRLPDAVALRAVRAQPDVQPALRHAADRARDRGLVRLDRRLHAGDPRRRDRGRLPLPRADAPALSPRRSSARSPPTTTPRRGGRSNGTGWRGTSGGAPVRSATPSCTGRWWKATGRSDAQNRKFAPSAKPFTVSSWTSLSPLWS